MAVLEKLPLDVSWDVSVEKSAVGGLHAPVAIITPSDDGKAHSYVYNMVSEMTDETSAPKVYDESTEVYKNAHAVSEAENYSAPIQVIEYPEGSNEVHDAKGNSDGSITENAQPKIVDTVLDYLDANNMFVIPTSDVGEKDVEAMSDALYNDRGGAVAYQVSDKNVMHTFSAHNKGAQLKDGNVLGVFEDRPLYPAANVAGYLAANAPMDAMKVGNQDEEQPTDLSAPEVRDVIKSGFNVVENKADSAMMATGKAVNGSYVDNFVDTKYIQDALTFTVQNYLNGHKTPYTQKGIDAIKSAVMSEAERLYIQGFFMNEPLVTAPSRVEVSKADYSKRIYAGLAVKGDLFNDIEQFNGHINITE